MNIDVRTDTLKSNRHVSPGRSPSSHPRCRLRGHVEKVTLELQEGLGWSTPESVGTLGRVEVDVAVIPTADSYALRHAVLRPHQSIDKVVWDNDDEPGTATFGAIERASRAIVGVATVFRESAPFDVTEAGVPPGAGSRTTTWRLRGMATRPDAQGQGIGSSVLRAVFDHVAAAGGDLLWCNAR